MTIFDFFRPKQTVPIIKGVREKYDQVLNQTCTRLILTIDVRTIERDHRLFLTNIFS